MQVMTYGAKFVVLSLLPAYMKHPLAIRNSELTHDRLPSQLQDLPGRIRAIYFYNAPGAAHAGIRRTVHLADDVQ